MSNTIEMELKQGKTWEFTGTALDRDGVPILWEEYGIRGRAKSSYSGSSSSWVWILTTGVAGEYSGRLGAVASALIKKGTYISDIEIYSLTDPDVVYEVSNINITVTGEVTT